jgi:hypothetical protein
MDDVINYTVIAYLIGDVKYKEVLIKQFTSKNELIAQYRELLNMYTPMKEFVMVMLNEELKICTAWALETPQKLKAAAELALNRYEQGEPFYIDQSIKMISLFGSTVYMEIIEKGKELQIIPQDYEDTDLAELATSVVADDTVSTTVSATDSATDDN